MVLDAFLVTGLGEGKTTVTRALARSFSRAVHIEGDVLSFGFVVAGLPYPFGDEESPDVGSPDADAREAHVPVGEEDFVVVLDDFVVDRDGPPRRRSRASCPG